MQTGKQKENRSSAGRRKSGGDGDNAGKRVFRQPHNTPSGDGCKAPLGILPATIDSTGMISVAGRHLVSVRDGVLRRTFDPGREFLRGGLAFRLDVLKLAQDAGATRIVCSERGKGRHWIISLDDFRDHGWLYEHAKFGNQWCCDLKHWRLIDNSAKPEPEAPPEPTLQPALL